MEYWKTEKDLVSIPSNRVMSSEFMALQTASDARQCLNPLESGHVFRATKWRKVTMKQVESQSPRIGSCLQSI